MPSALLQHNCSARFKEQQGRAGHTHALESRVDRQTKRIQLILCSRMYGQAMMNQGWMNIQFAVTLMHLGMRLYHNDFRSVRNTDPRSNSNSNDMSSTAWKSVGLILSSRDLLLVETSVCTGHWLVGSENVRCYDYSETQSGDQSLSFRSFHLKWMERCAGRPYIPC